MVTHSIDIPGADPIRIYPLGDLHIGAYGCAEEQLQEYIKNIAEDPRGYVLLGGDLIDAVILQDAKRFHPETLPAWMLEGLSVDVVQEHLSDIVGAQLKRLYAFLEPIRGKIVGAIEGNHESVICKRHNRNVHGEICDHFGCVNLTDAAVVRFSVGDKKRKQRRSVCKVFICHGNGGGRTPGSEPNHLHRLGASWDVDVVLRGHSHTFCIAPPQTMLTVADTGHVRRELLERYKFAANWGAWMLSYPAGPSSYASRANYPARPLYTVIVELTPKVGGTPDITMLSHKCVV